MSQASCSYCRRLPSVAQRAGKGRAISCPHCAQPLWITPGGVVSRLDCAAPPPVARRWPWLAGLALGAAACLYVAALGVGTIATVFSKSALPQAQDRPVPSAEPIQMVEHRQEVAGPFAETKPAFGPEMAQVKPILETVVKAAAKDRGAELDGQVARAKANTQVIPANWRWSLVNAPAEDVQAQLAAMPQVDLDPDFARKSRAQIVQLADEINRVSKDRHEAFHRKLIKERTDLAGLPFMMGRACLLSGKESTALARNSLNIRTTLDFVEAFNRQRAYPDAGDALEQFLSTAKGRALKDCWQTSECIPALHQIVSAEAKDLRLVMIKYLKAMKDPHSTETLVNRAVFDLDADVRQAALEALKLPPSSVGPNPLMTRRKEDYKAELRKALRYPWAPVVRNAAHAVAALELTEMVPELLGMLHAPSPDAPYTVEDEAGKPQQMIREVVRINHHRNCMLCHDPVHESLAPPDLPAFTQETPAGPVPSADRPFPSGSGTVYYARQNGIILVRADVTYLRQDFSMRQEVADPGKWPKMQRFDFFVRARPISAAELGQRAHAPTVSAHQLALIAAIQALTGEQNPPQLVAWRAVFNAKSAASAN